MTDPHQPPRPPHRPHPHASPPLAGLVAAVVPMSAAGAMALTGVFLMLAAAMTYLADEDGVTAALVSLAVLCLIAAPWIAVAS